MTQIHLFTGVKNFHLENSLWRNVHSTNPEHEEVDCLNIQTQIPKSRIYNREEFLEGLKDFGIDFLPLPDPFRNSWASAQLRFVIPIYLVHSDTPQIVWLYPETGLHPSLQAELVRYVVRNLGTKQLSIATHSESVLNALRIAIWDMVILTEDVTVFHCLEDETTEIKITSEGRIETWPEFFFDQTGKDFRVLFQV